ncbi:unnamed protein product, partial [Closterium sp. NIES-53]
QGVVWREEDEVDEFAVCLWDAEEAAWCVRISHPPQSLLCSWFSLMFSHPFRPGRGGSATYLNHSFVPRCSPHALTAGQGVVWEEEDEVDEFAVCLWDAVEAFSSAAAAAKERHDAAWQCLERIRSCAYKAFSATAVAAKERHDALSVAVP